MRVLVAAFAALALAGCGEDTGATPGAGDPDAPVSSTPGQPPAGAPKECTLAPRRVVGRTESAARALAERHGCVMRVIERDGMVLAVTEDYSESRINVRVRDDRVTAHDGRY
jgi:hypothetical protein